MKRYLVFACSEFYPDGGLLDVCFHSNDEGEAVNIAQTRTEVMCYVWDRIEDIILYDKDDKFAAMKKFNGQFDY